MTRATREDERIRERRPVTRREVLRIGIAVFSGTTLVGRVSGSSNVNEELLYIGYVFRPEYGTYHEFVPFQIFIRYRESHASIGRGKNVCRNPERAYVPYEIQYHNSEQKTAFLAVPLANKQDSLPHEYFVPRTRFQFIESDGTYVFQGDCDNPPTPVQHGVLTPVV